MDKRILLIADKDQNFLVNVIAKGLDSAGYYVQHAVPDVEKIAAQGSLPDIFIVYLHGVKAEFDDVLSFLRSYKRQRQQQQVFVYLIGNDGEISSALSVIPGALVAGSFVQPVNIGTLVSKLNEDVKADIETGGRRRILVVDDDGIALRAMNNWLSKKYEVLMANSGMNAITLLSQRKVDLILLDYEMPVASGLQVFEMLKSEPSTAEIPVIFLTGKDDKETVVKVLAAKPKKYLLKTMPPEELVAAVDSFFNGEE